MLNLLVHHVTGRGLKVKSRANSRLQLEQDESIRLLEGEESLGYAPVFGMSEFH